MSTLLIPLSNNVCHIFNDSSNLKFVICSKLIACLLNPSVVIWGHLFGLQLGWEGATSSYEHSCKMTGAPNENIVQNHLHIALLNVF